MAGPTTFTKRIQPEGSNSFPTASKMVRTMISSFSLFLVLLIVHHDVFVTVDAFATISRARTPGTYMSERTMMWSSSKTSTLEEETATDNIVDTSKSSSPESPPESESTTAEVAIKDVNGDDDIKALVDGEDKKDESEEENLMQKIKDSGVAGVISYAAWELAFWTVSVPVCILGYKEVTGHWPDFKDKDDLSKLGAEAFAFVNFARFAVPLRIGLALGTTPWIQENVVDVFLVEENKNDDKAEGVIADKIENEDENDDKTIEIAPVENEGVIADKIENAGEKDDKTIEIAPVENEGVIADKIENEDEKDDKTIEIAPVENEGNDSNSDETNSPDDTGSVEQENTQSTVGRFRIRTRIGNLINRIRRRKASSQESDKQ